MSRAAIALAGVVLALSTGGGGYLWGHAAGKAAEVARRDGQAVRQLGQLIDSQRGLVEQANAASARLRRAAATRATRDAVFGKEFRDALARTAGDRAGCRFDDDSVRQLGAARDRAAAAAAGGAAAELPAAGAGAGR